MPLVNAVALTWALSLDGEKTSSFGPLQTNDYPFIHSVEIKSTYWIFFHSHLTMAVSSTLLEPSKRTQLTGMLMTWSDPASTETNINHSLQLHILERSKTLIIVKGMLPLGSATAGCRTKTSTWAVED
jgi:hypothetical protein